MTARMYSHGQRRRVVVTALCTAATFALAGVLATPAFAKSCHASGHKLYNAHGVIVFTHSDHGKYPVFICASPSYKVKQLEPGSIDASVTSVKRAGHYVGFFLNLNLDYYVQYLVVYNRDRGRIELEDLSQCGANDQCIGPDIASFGLATNGWIAEEWEDLVSSPGDALLATDGGPRHYQLEFGGVSDLSISGNTAHWVSPSGGKSSAVLGSGVVPNPNFTPLSACQLLTAADVQSLVGSAVGTAGSGDCTYAGADGTLEVSLATGLTSSDEQTQINDLENDFYNTPGPQWPGNLDVTDLGNEPAGDVSGPQTDGFFGFYRGVEIEIQYMSDNDQQATVSHLATVALERLLAIIVGRELPAPRPTTLSRSIVALSYSLCGRATETKRRRCRTSQLLRSNGCFVST
jgi:hypothetical protein